MIRPLALLFGLALAASAGASARAETQSLTAYATELYSESAFASPQDAYSTMIRARIYAGPQNILSPYALFNQELTKLHSLGAPNETGSFQALGAGARLLLPWSSSITAEARYRFLPDQPLDFKSVAARFQRIDFTVARDPKWFFENYQEAVFLSSDADNLIFTAYARPGRDLVRWKSGALDAHLELVAGLDRNRRDYNTRLEQRPGLRVSQQLGPIVASLYGSYAWQSWLDRPIQRGPRFLLVIGGYF